jgi:hypothetical protein
MVGTRALADRTLADELREACMNVAVRMGGWDNGRAQSRRVLLGTWRKTVSRGAEPAALGVASAIASVKYSSLLS